MDNRVERGLVHADYNHRVVLRGSWETNFFAGAGGEEGMRVPSQMSPGLRGVGATCPNQPHRAAYDLRDQGGNGKEVIGGFRTMA